MANNNNIAFLNNAAHTTNIQGSPVSPAAPTDGYVLTWSASDGYYKTKAVPTGFSAGGDLSGTAINQTVTKIQGHPVSSVAPTDGYALVWSASDGYYKTMDGLVIGTTAGTACDGADTRLSDPRAASSVSDSVLRASAATLTAPLTLTAAAAPLNPYDAVRLTDLPGPATVLSGIDEQRPLPSAGNVGKYYYATDSGILYEYTTATTCVPKSYVATGRAAYGPFVDHNHQIRSIHSGQGPAGGPGYTLALCFDTLSLATVEGETGILWEFTDSSNKGWFIYYTLHASVGISRTSCCLQLVGVDGGYGTTNAICPLALTTGIHAVAFSVASEGGSVRACIDGGAIMTVGLTGTYQPNPGGAGINSIGGYLTSANMHAARARMSWCKAWTPILSDANMQAATTNPGNMRAGVILPLSVFDWNAARHKPGDSYFETIGNASGTLGMFDLNNRPPFVVYP